MLRTLIEPDVVTVLKLRDEVFLHLLADINSRNDVVDEHLLVVHEEVGDSGDAPIKANEGLTDLEDVAWSALEGDSKCAFVGSEGLFEERGHSCARILVAVSLSDDASSREVAVSGLF